MSKAAYYQHIHELIVAIDTQWWSHLYPQINMVQLYEQERA
ncbi:MAG TPA: hypothetical protein V6C85_18655 [Allocoleopsis sp.]